MTTRPALPDKTPPAFFSWVPREQIPIAAAAVVSRADATVFDGSTNYLARGAGLTGAADGDSLTIAGSVKFNGGNAAEQNLVKTNQSKIQLYKQTSNTIRIIVKDTANVDVCDLVSTTTLTDADAATHIAFSVTQAGSSPFAYLAINGVIEDSAVVSNLTAIDMTAGDWAVGADTSGNSKLNGELSNFVLAPQYYDSPRWFYEDGVLDIGSDGTNVVTSALIALQDGLTQGGTGGTFTENGTFAAATEGPALGTTPGLAHTYDGTNDYQTRGAGLTGAVDGKKLTIAFAIDFDGGDGVLQRSLAFKDGSGNGVVEVTRFANENMRFQVRNVGASLFESVQMVDGQFAAEGFAHWTMSIDTTTGAETMYIAKNGVKQAEASLTSMNNLDIDLTVADVVVGASANLTGTIFGKLSQFVLSPEYHSDPATFYNGGVVDIGPDGTKVVTTALIAMRDGKTNRGTGGAFTITGDIGSTVDGPELA